jgi:hypothetical protein
MKLHLDLLKYLTAEDIAEAAASNVHRYRPEPLFSETGTGSLLPATEEDREREMRESEALIERLKARAAQAQGNEKSAS